MCFVLLKQIWASKRTLVYCHNLGPIKACSVPALAHSGFEFGPALAIKVSELDEYKYHKMLLKSIMHEFENTQVQTVGKCELDCDPRMFVGGLAFARMFCWWPICSPRGFGAGR